MEEVAAEALVSRATAYRHFPRVEALLVEAPIEAAKLEKAPDTETDSEKRKRSAVRSNQTRARQESAASDKAARERGRESAKGNPG